jgi:hypothetical protein
MPTKYKEEKNKKLDEKLTSQYKQAVKKAEDHIDEQIELQWGSGSTLIDRCIVMFECDPITGDPITVPPDKKQIMTDLLFSRYYDAGWKNYLAVNGQWRFTPINTK